MLPLILSKKSCVMFVNWLTSSPESFRLLMLNYSFSSSRGVSVKSRLMWFLLQISVLQCSWQKRWKKRVRRIKKSKCAFEGCVCVWHEIIIRGGSVAQEGTRPWIMLFSLHSPLWLIRIWSCVSFRITLAKRHRKSDNVCLINVQWFSIYSLERSEKKKK